MNEGDFKRRTKQLALRAIRVAEALPQSRSGEIIGRQLIRSATSVGANYRSACRGKSTADVIAKLSIVEEEADESLYWLEIIIEAELLPSEKLSDLMSEMNEIVAMTVASIKTLRNKSIHMRSKIQNSKFKVLKHTNAKT